MKKILVLSDTHMPKFSKIIPKVLIDIIKEVDLIIHAGDFCSYETYVELTHYKKVIAVYGNNDDQLLKEKLNQKEIFQIEEVKIGLTHGDGDGKTAEKRVLDTFIDDDVDIMIFGHSHIPLIKNTDTGYLFNPGSPTNKRKEKQYSYGFIKIDRKDFTLKHCFYDKK